MDSLAAAPLQPRVQASPVGRCEHCLELEHPESEHAVPKPRVDTSRQWTCRISLWVHESSTGHGTLREGGGLFGLFKKNFSCRSVNTVFSF